MIQIDYNVTELSLVTVYSPAKITKKSIICTIVHIIFAKFVYFYIEIPENEDFWDEKMRFRCTIVRGNVAFNTNVYYWTLTLTFERFIFAPRICNYKKRRERWVLRLK